MDSIWEQLSCFESHDFVGQWYKAKHARELNSARTKDITCCFTQGKEYFASATQAATAVRPLLLFYGAVSLARGLTLLRDRTKNAESLKPSHGLEPVDWQNTLAGGTKAVLGLQVRATKGTFTELVGAAGNLQPTAWWSGPEHQVGQYHAQYPPAKFVDDGSVLSLDDIVSRDHRLLSLYRSTTKRPTKVHIGEVFFGPGQGAQVSLFATENVTPQVLQEHLGFPQGTTVRDRNGTPRLPRVPNFYVQLNETNAELLKTKLPATQYTDGDAIFVLEDFPNGDRLNELTRTYLMAYFLGMLVRYFPSHWMTLSRNEKGDLAQPLLIAAMNIVARDFPVLIRSNLN